MSSEETSFHCNTGQSIVELASGIDALYLSGRASLPDELIDSLEELRKRAEQIGGPLPVHLGDVDFKLVPYNLGRYRYRLEHPYGVIGFTLSNSLPAVRVQPRAEVLHGIGPVATVRFFADVLGAEVGPLLLTVSRLDLFADVQGWQLIGDDRHRFTGRARELNTYENGTDFSGFVFGKRKTGTILARIYDKTRESKEKGTDYWPEIWGTNFNPALPVLRVEFEIGRTGLAQYGIFGPDEALAACDALWTNVTTQWLTYRTPTDDQTRSRWPIAEEWLAVQHASIANGAIGLDRITEGKRLGNLRLLMPRLVGDLTSFAVLTDTSSLRATIANAHVAVDAYARQNYGSFESRVNDKRAGA